MAYVDGTAGKAVIRHIRRCPACAQQAEELAALQALLKAKLYRFSCPTSEQLIAYRQGELQGGEKLLAAQHLRQCPHCARELAALARSERRAGLIRAAIKVWKAAPAALRAQAAGVRSVPETAPPPPQIHRMGEVEVIISQVPSRTFSHRWDISGLVHIAGRVPETISGARVELYRGEGLIAITTVGPHGHFTFKGMEAGDYEINLVGLEHGSQD